ncbi:hypothetical protein HOP50_01g01320 [Chloropicon primus]|uniref:Uncharacterized protein n=1 Tax=Chloropicon primus TaxID=1764295 RepID=A0A5B8MDC8_9CHLO|nr:hypothetical protein A3770_01p01430 [Chloropicon primus]UPQ96841.1 hypothetical protein HOP50_01g01320 [Chloropicon primus]|mmetsp:Transcript_12645/g.35280  ORF Transcript_12645/g.35280 Transcript_12645/m.35280 type:complete len:147 (+) Transcript_12645:202-642(+)|eukprot:QDZ17625.1 hypothetical protein A3770_01p01430 [Chloropicon primus]
MFSKKIKALALSAMLVGTAALAPTTTATEVELVEPVGSDGRQLLHAPLWPEKKGGGVGHHLAQAAALTGAVVGAAGLATEAYGLSTGDKNAQAIGAAELGGGAAVGVGGGLGAVASRCHYNTALGRVPCDLKHLPRRPFNGLPQQG